MNRLKLLLFGFMVSHTYLYAGTNFYVPLLISNLYITDSLPAVLSANREDLIKSKLRNEAILKFSTYQVPANLEEWESSRKILRERIVKNSGFEIDHNLPLDMKETGIVRMKGYTIKNIYFQTHPGVYATANLYIPEGEGPFPAVINMHGHWKEGKMSENVQALGHSLALNGYVCLSIDAFGAGERTTTHGDYEYHGDNLGASLINLGESLLGVQITDNMRGVDLLTSLPYVDADKIGATGASGGGNQTMWFAALDERVKATLPIVSVGTFESAVMGSNCVCELMPGGLTFTETSGVLSLFAPRALKMCNHYKDSNPTFYPLEMLRSYNNAKPIFQLYGVEDHISYELFDLPHGYWKEDREAMLGWFDLHLKGKGTGASKNEELFELLPMEQLMVFEEGQRDPKVMGTGEYSRNKGEKLRNNFLKHQDFDKPTKKEELRKILQINEPSELLKTHHFSSKDGWDRVALETTDDKLIPMLHRAPEGNGKEYTLISNTSGKNGVSTTLINELKQKGSGIIIIELSGTGEASSRIDTAGNSLSQFHTLARAHLWLGKTMMGEWVKEWNLAVQFVTENYGPKNLRIDASKEAGLAALLWQALGEENNQVDGLTLRNVPLSYQFDSRENIDYFSMGIHLPGILRWGDVSLATALIGKEVNFIEPVSMSGKKLSGNVLSDFQMEFEKVKALTRQKGKSTFIQ